MFEKTGVDVFQKKKIIEIPKPSNRENVFKEGKTMEIYITDLAAYNNGYLIGEWVALPMDEEDLKAKITEILAIGAKACGDTEHAEIFITDYESDLVSIGEYDNIFSLNTMAEKSESLNGYEIKAVRFLLNNNLVKNFDEAMECFEDVIIHEDTTLEDLAYELVNECYSLDSLPSIIANNIDYEKIGRELEMDGRYYEEDGDIYEYII